METPSRTTSPTRSRLPFALAFAGLCVAPLLEGCVDRSQGTTGTGGAGGGATPDMEVPIVVPDGGGDALLPDLAFLVDALPTLDASPPPVDAALPPADYEPLPDAAPDTRDPLCRELPPLSGEDQFDWVGDCGGARERTIRGMRNPTCRNYEQPPSEPPGLDITLDDVVVTAIYGHDFVVQDVEGVAYNALWVHNQGGLDTTMLRAGTHLALEGELVRFFDLDELLLPGGGWEILGDEAPIEPTPLVDARRVADGGDLARPLESRLVTLTNQRVINTAPDCPSEFGNVVLDSTLWVGNEADYDYAPGRDDVLRSITGVLSVSFDHRKILPRDNADFDPIACGGLPDKCETAECPVAVDAPESGALVITEIQNNPTGNDNDREFVEIYNPGGEPVDLTGWWVQDCGGRRAPLSGEIDADGLLVIAANTNERNNGGVPADLPMGDLFLPNGFGSVLIFDAAEALVDQVRYEPADPWPSRSPGESLELLDPASDNRVGDNWAEGRRSYGDGGKGTPGELR